MEDIELQAINYKEQSITNSIFVNFSRFAITGVFFAIIIVILGALKTKAVTNFLSQPDYGYMVTWLSLSGVITILCVGSFTKSIYRFYNKNLELRKFKGGLLWTSVILAEFFLLLFFVFIAVIHFMFGVELVKNDSYIVGLVIITVISFPRILYRILISIQSSEHDTIQAGITNIVYAVTLFLLATLLSFFTKSPFITLLSYSVACIIPVIVFLPSKIRSDSICFLSRNEVMRVLKLGAPLISQNLLDIFVQFAILGFILFYRGPIDAAYIGVALNVTTLVEVVLSYLDNSYAPFVISSYNYDPIKGKTLPKRFNQLFLLITILLVVWVSVLSPMLIELISNEHYLPAAICIPFFLSSRSCLRLGRMEAIGLMIKEKTEIELIISVIGIVVLLISSYLLIPSFGILGAGIATLIYGIAFYIFYIIVGRISYPIGISLGYGLKTTFLSSICFLVAILGYMFIQIMSPLLPSFLTIPYLALLTVTSISTILFSAGAFLFHLITMNDFKFLLSLIKTKSEL